MIKLLPTAAADIPVMRTHFTMFYSLLSSKAPAQITGRENKPVTETHALGWTHSSALAWEFQTFPVMFQPHHSTYFKLHRVT